MGQTDQKSMFWRLSLCLIATQFLFGSAGLSQSSQHDLSKPGIAANAPASPVIDYRIGPRDVLGIKVGDSPELSGKFRVSDTGYLRLLGLPALIKAEGLTAAELSNTIAEALKGAELLRDPQVNVFIEEYHSRAITVLGAVQKPSVYSLEKPTTVLEALSMAGGLTPTAGIDLTILRTESLEPQGPSEAQREPSSRQSTLKIDLASLLSGKDPAGNVLLRPEDVLTVSTAPVVYVVGAVGKPGAFVIQDPNSGLTVLKAVALAEGLKPIASGKHCLIIRRTANSQQPEDIPVDLAQLMAHKIQDIPMSFNDILFVPESSSKKNMRAMAQTAQSALVGIATYGIGYRVAR